MPFDVVTSAEFDEEFSRLPPLVQVAVLDHIDALATDPLSLSRPSGIPYVRKGMLYSFRVNDGATIHYITIRFVYSDVRSESQIQLLMLHDMAV